MRSLNVEEIFNFYREEVLPDDEERGYSPFFVIRKFFSNFIKEVDFDYEVDFHFETRWVSLDDPSEYYFKNKKDPFYEPEGILYNELILDSYKIVSPQDLVPAEYISKKVKKAVEEAIKSNEKVKTVTIRAKAVPKEIYEVAFKIASYFERKETKNLERLLKNLKEGKKEKDASDYRKEAAELHEEFYKIYGSIPEEKRTETIKDIYGKFDRKFSDILFGWITEPEDLKKAVDEMRLLLNKLKKEVGQ